MAAAVVNASPLIFLAKLGQLDALQVYRPVLTTRVVLEEVEAGLSRGHRDALAVRRAVDERRILVRKSPPLELPEAKLDPGELSVVALATAVRGAVAVVDDLPAIRAAKGLGVSVRSTPYVLLENVIEGRLEPDHFHRLLDQLLRLDYRLGPALYVNLLREAERLGTRK